ncbi:cytochrome c oxidase subunit I (mitochondrion) [Babesia bovis T2Bo]|uniref:Cytochrome c oxidase subunit 1 n=1 Tax=Babesia bovis TaxID=5865 RepID=A7XE89_BABBO|nr:cytochrome c oxidase subunit I [Babesia bovis T2Bo]ABU97452.1 cytochrome c oxidase subunit I [Babesia bovis]BAI66171.1 cytochrome oxidase subunit I [Babesia bovis]|eukprot:YP_001504106.1 cytochrome c oxidase subunit I (mitochondrion) [Babesia bovis T2Bo]
MFAFAGYSSVSANHKVIGISYIWLSYWFGVIGFYMSILIRTELSMSGLKIMTMDTLEIYNMMFSLHGLIMIFFNVMTGLFGGIGNYLYPIILGAADVVFPRANLYSLFLQPVAFGLVIASVYLEMGSGTGWTLYPPLSTSISSLGVDFIIFGLLASGIASAMSGANFVVTFGALKSIGQTIDRLSVLAWSIVLTAFLLLVSLPVVTSVLLMVFLDRHYNTMFFESSNSGDPILYQHLFWFFGHPEVYILILPGFGIISLIVCTYCGKELFGNLTMILAMISIALLGCLVWAHHMYTSGLEADTRAFFTTTTILIALPTGNKIFNWVCTLQEAVEVRNLGTVLMSIMFVITFVIGGVTGVILGNAGVDISLHDTLYVVGHFHFVLSIGAIISLLSFIFYCQRLLVGTIFSNQLILIIIPAFMAGIFLTFMPMHFLGFTPLPRRIPDYPDDMWGWNFLCTIGSTMIFFLKLITVIFISL